MPEKYKYRYVKGPYGNAVQDTPRTFSEETGIDSGKEFWNSRPEDRSYSDGGRAYSKKYEWQLEKRKPTKYKGKQPKKFFTLSRFKSRKKPPKGYMIVPLNKNRTKPEKPIFPGKRVKMPKSNSQEHRIKEMK